MDSTLHDTTLQQRLAVCALGLVACVAWLLQHPFASIDHDSVLYTEFVLAKLHPQTVGWDVVVRFGSQDRFTIFSPIYLAVVQTLGIEHGAAVLLLLAEALLFGCAWLLARRFMSRLDATLALALLVTLPSEYGSGGIFRYVENFLTPRMPAEALVIGAITAALRQRYGLAAGCILVSMLLHPIMGAAGAAFLVLAFAVPLRPKLALAAGSLGFIVAVVIVLAIAPLGRLTDPDWMHAIHTQVGYLFVSTWGWADWSRIAVPLTLLALGWRVGATPLLRRMCLSALGLVTCGMLITLVFADLLHVWLFISLQAWRWLWLADVLAVVLAPAILQDCWQRGDGGRVAVVVLGIAWIFRGLTLDFLATNLAFALAIVPAGWGQHRYWRLLSLGACVVLGLGISLTLIDRFTYISLGYTDHDILLQEVRSVCSDGFVLMTVSFLGWAMLRRANSRFQNRAFALAQIVFATVLCLWLIPHAWRSYSDAHFTPELAGRFAPWRAEIPPHAEVLWPDTALAAWYLLERPSYWSPQQVAGGLFSKQQALIMEHRTRLVRTAMENSNLLAVNGSREEIATQHKTTLPTNVSHMDLKAMVALCGDPELQYIVSRAHLTSSPFPPVIVEPSKVNGRMYLFRCADLRP